MPRHFAPIAALALGTLMAIAASAAPSKGARSPLDPDSRACLQCHTIAFDHSHPVGVRGRNVPGLPLTAAGKLACSTCHQQPASLQRHAANLGRGAALRRPVATLCTSCHTDPGRPGSVLAHGLRLRRAHLIPGSSELGLETGLLDRESLLCLSCHDGGIASPAGVRLGAGPGGSPQHVQASRRGTTWQTEHPIGVPFPSRSANPREQARRGSLPDGVRLFAGNVGCGSCHSVYSGIGQMLSVTQRGSTLCLTCHIK